MKKAYKYIIVVLLSALIIFFIFKVKFIREIFYTIFISFIISYTLRPLHKKATEDGINRRLSAGMIIILFVLVIALAFTAVIPSLFSESMNISAALKQIENYINFFDHKIKIISNNKIILNMINHLYVKINDTLAAFFSNAIDNLFKISENILSISVIPIISYYFLADSEYISNRIMIIFPCKSRNMLKKVAEDIDSVLSRYILSQIFLSILVGALTLITLVIYKVQFPIFLSLLNGIFNIIPYFGPLFGAIPAIIAALLKSPQTALWVTFWLYAIQQFEGDMISPKITGESVSMHPLIVIILLIVGGEIGGFLGMVLAVPFGVILKIIYEDLNYYMF